jgi:hypothetical protein
MKEHVDQDTARYQATWSAIAARAQVWRAQGVEEAISSHPN